MNIQEEKWFGRYRCSPTGLKASEVSEPKISEYGIEKEICLKNFNWGLDNHVVTILENLHKYNGNPLLKNRLKKYGRSEALDILNEIEDLLSRLPKFKAKW